MSMANRMRAFRQAKGLTQDALAAEWGVSSRTIARWERGEGRPAEWMSRQLAAIESPLEWPSMSVIRQFVEQAEVPGMIVDEKLKVLTATRLHRRWMQARHGFEIVGVDWHRHISEGALAMIEAGGGMPAMIRNGLMCTRGFYQDPGGGDGSEMPTDLYVNMTVLRVPDYGSLCLVISRPAIDLDKEHPLRTYFMDE